MGVTCGRCTRGSALVKVSVIIPAWNAEASIEAAIRSVREQSYPAHEIIVVDDGSTDATCDRIDHLGGLVTVIRQDRGGVGAARNRGMTAATGDWIAFLDADDTWAPHRLQAQHRILQRHPDLVWVSGGFSIRLPDGSTRLMALTRKAHSLLRDDAFFPDFYRAARAKARFHTCTMLIRRDACLDLGGFDPSLRTGEDQDLWYRLADRYPSIGYVNQSLFTYDRSHQQSLTRIQTSYSDNLYRVFQKHLPPGARPSRGPFLSKELYFRTELFRAVRHAVRHGETANVQRLIEAYASYMRLDQRLMAHVCAAAPPTILRAAASMYRRAARRSKL